MAYTPAASRSGYQERSGGEEMAASQSSSKDQAVAEKNGGGLPPPSSSSSSSSEALAKYKRHNSASSMRDVAVRPRPVDYGSAVVETFFACAGPGAMSTVMDDSVVVGGRRPGSRRSTSAGSTRDGGNRAGRAAAAPTSAPSRSYHMAEVAAYVAAGGVVPPGDSLDAASTIVAARRYNDGVVGDDRGGGGISSRRLPIVDNHAGAFSPCPTLPPARLLSEWNMLSSLARSMAYQSAGSYCETEYARTGGPFERIAEYRGGVVGGGCAEAPFAPIECLGMIWGIANDARLPTTTTAPAVSEGTSTVAPEKVFDAHLLQLLGVAVSPAMGAEEKGQKLSEMLMDIVIDVALIDINLCQRLFFLLRSFIGEFEERRVPQGHVSTHDCNVSDESTHALRCCRYSQRRLSARMFDKAIDGGYPINRESTTSSRIKQHQNRVNFRQLSISPTEGSIGDNHCSLDTATTAAVTTSWDGGCYPHHELCSLSPSTLDDIEVADVGARILVKKSTSEDLPVSSSGSSRENYDHNPSTLEQHDDPMMSKQKKRKSKKILGILKVSGKSVGGSKKLPSDRYGNVAPNNNTPSAPSCNNGNNNKKSPRYKSAFSFSSVFLKQQAPSLQTIDCIPPPSSPPTGASSLSHDASEHISLSEKFENMAWILRQLDNSCSTIERNLMKTFSQKMADWALSSWSASKENALASVTQGFRSELKLMNPPPSPSAGQHRPNNNAFAVPSSKSARFPILNPVDPSELLTSVDADECFILPSSHFPLLLCFNSEYRAVGSPKALPESGREYRALSPQKGGDGGNGRGDTLYRTSIEILGLRSTALPFMMMDAFIVQGAIAGVMQESGVCYPSRTFHNSLSGCMPGGFTLVFDTSSSWGHPKTLALKVSCLSTCTDGPVEESHDPSDLGCGFVDLCPMWNMNCCANVELKTKIYQFDSAEEFDQHGETGEKSAQGEESLELHFRISAEVISSESQTRKRLLLYKHGDDLRQELLAIQFIEKCNQILLSSGLDLKLKTFSCQPVGNRTGFIEWVRGTVPLSELCKASSSSHLGSNNGVDSRQSSRNRETEGGSVGHSLPMEEGSGHQTADKVPPQSHRWFKYRSLRGLPQKSNGSVIENPIQDFLRSAAYDVSAPYLVKKDVMATYVKSCAGYCVITYLLGVGDRHLDNILLHQNGHLLHCDYSFILGQDPKTYLPMRITEEMIKGFGGRASDNFDKFLSFTGAAFLALRRHNNVHTLLSHVGTMVHANLEDLSINQPPEEAVLAMRGRFRLDLNDDDALAYIEHVIEKSITSKMWRAVDVMHSLGKHF